MEEIIVYLLWALCSLLSLVAIPVISYLFALGWGLGITKSIMIRNYMNKERTKRNGEE